MHLRSNKLGDEGWCAIFDALRDNPQNKIAKWDLINQGIDPTISKSLAAYMAVSASLTMTNLLKNNLDKESATMLTKIAAEKKISLCGIGPDQTSAKFSEQGLGPIDSILIASDLGVRASLTEVGTAELVCL